MMSNNRLVHALYEDDDTLLSAVKMIRSEKIHIEEVYTPFPVHGLDKVLGLEDTRIAIMAFIYGCIGFIVSIAMLSTNHVVAIWFDFNLDHSSYR